MTDKFFIGAEPIGSGAFGKVYEAYNWSNGEKFAIKEIQKVPLCKNEAKIMMSLNHPCIVKLIEAAETTNAWYIRMNYFDGGSLHSRLDRGILDEKEAKFYFYQISKGVEYLHGLNIVHRDLKPKNMVLKSANAPYTLLKIIDFGVSKTDSCMRSVIGSHP